jgi:hypothetical protein
MPAWPNGRSAYPLQTDQPCQFAFLAIIRHNGFGAVVTLSQPEGSGECPAAERDDLLKVAIASGRLVE